MGKCSPILKAVLTCSAILVAAVRFCSEAMQYSNVVMPLFYLGCMHKCITLHLHNRKEWVLVPVQFSDQCEHSYMVLYFPFGPCTSPSPIPVLCEYPISFRKSDTVQVPQDISFSFPDIQKRLNFV